MRKGSPFPDAPARGCSLILVGLATILLCGGPISAGGENLYTEGKILLVVPEHLDPLETYAIAELTEHLQAVVGQAPETVSHRKATTGNRIVIGRIENNGALRQLVKAGFFKNSRGEQGYSIRIDRDPRDAQARSWLAVLCGADPPGVLYAVRDFVHYHFYKDNSGVALQPANVELSPRLKLRGLSLSGCNLFSAKNDRKGFLHTVKLNYFSEDVTFDKRYFIDWLSEWKINYISLLWCNYPAYDEARRELVKYAHARGIKVLGFYVPYRPAHEKPPPSVSKLDAMLEHGDCPRNPEVRKWYLARLAELVSREPRIDMIQIESPYHDGVYCRCPVCNGTKNAYPEDKMLEEMLEVVRKHRPEIPVVRGMKQPVPDEAAARRLAKQLKKLAAPQDWHMNTYLDRLHRRRWHDLGPKFATYLRLYRSALKGVDEVRDVNFLFNDFRMSAERDVVAHQFCYRFYGGRFGSYPVEQDEQMRKKCPDRKGPFSLALTAEAAFDPFLEGETRYRKIERIHALTIPDYPRGRPLNLAKLKAAAAQDQEPTTESGPAIMDPAAHPPASKLLRIQYGIKEPGFLIAQVCADLDNDGRREIVYSSRGTKMTHLLWAANGLPLWSAKVPGDHQSIMAYDLDGDGALEILYSVSSPGGLCLLDRASGKVLKRWDAEDWKVGNSAVIIDADGDGVLDGYFGTRSKYLVRMNLKEWTHIARRTGWQQCGCHTSAMDVDHDGRWDLFAGTGDDGAGRKGAIHRLDPLTLKSVWSYKTDDNASTAEMILADIDGDGEVEILKSVDSSHGNDDQHDALYAFETDGTLVWKNTSIREMYSPNVADLDGDGSIEIIGMSLGCEVYCLDGEGRTKWRKDLRPEIDDGATNYMTPVLCDVNGDKHLEIVALTNGGFFNAPDRAAKEEPNGIVFVLSAHGEILDRFDLGSPRFWGFAFSCNVDKDPFMELVVSGSGGMDVIETKGLGPNSEQFQRRRTYQRLNVVPWAYEDTYFIYRGRKQGVKNLTDNVVLQTVDGRYRDTGTYTTELLTLPPGCSYDAIHYQVHQPAKTMLRLNILAKGGEPIASDVKSGQPLKINQPVRLQFVLGSTDGSGTPTLDSYRLSFGRQP